MILRLANNRAITTQDPLKIVTENPFLTITLLLINYKLPDTDNKKQMFNYVSNSSINNRTQKIQTMVRIMEKTAAIKSSSKYYNI